MPNEVMPMKKSNVGNSPGKKIYSFNKLVGIERLHFHQRSKLLVRTMSSWSRIEDAFKQNKINTY